MHPPDGNYLVGRAFATSFVAEPRPFEYVLDEVDRIGSGVDDEYGIGWIHH